MSLPTLQKTHGYKQILVENGAPATNKYYTNELDFSRLVRRQEHSPLTMHPKLLPSAPSDSNSPKTLEEIMPFDMLVLAIFNGKISRELIGQPFGNFENISERFDLMQHTETVATEDGEWSITFWKRKSLGEFCKIYEMNQIAAEGDVKKAEEYINREIKLDKEKREWSFIQKMRKAKQRE
eukprot:CAMPEP_0170485302 /NCGR_PEP_ID=MMETSP0208-20121228/4601_1 /TAXON_ID=197538 /ORGANISM="Strombidium inclinatum, Strain S3" /LENGTH=180 /DNA_ID=CAMNT_0010758913 /DNA_START=608 /DNA_END=1149 /DNA_ORIENTATION=-